MDENQDRLRFGDDLRRKTDNILYRTGDRLLERRNRIEAHLRRHQEKLNNIWPCLPPCPTDCWGKPGQVSIHSMVEKGN